MRKLPPMNAVRAFEAAVRTSSLTRAAQELNVTHGAISRQIRVLEQHIGAKLFNRSGRGLTPTAQARYYASEVASGLDRIDAATTRLMEPASTRIVRVNAPPTIVMHWLVPRLSTFQIRFPDTEIRLSASTAAVEEALRTADVVLRRRKEAGNGLISLPILSGAFVPMCAPGILGDRRPDSASVLKDHTLVEADTMPNLWDDWLRQNGTDPAGFRRRQRYENFYIAFRAAIEGLGIVMASPALVAAEVEAGKLVSPLEGLAVAAEPLRAFYTSQTRRRARVLAFVEWLKEQGDAEAAG